MNTTKNNATQLSEMYSATGKSIFNATGGFVRTDYTFDFKFTSKEDYLRFRDLWKAVYAEETANARAVRAAHTAYRNAGGFGRKTVKGNLEEATKTYNATHETSSRQHRRMLIDLRIASKKHAQACYLAARAEKTEQAAA